MVGWLSEFVASGTQKLKGGGGWGVGGGGGLIHVVVKDCQCRNIAALCEIIAMTKKNKNKNKKYKVKK